LGEPGNAVEKQSREILPKCQSTYYIRIAVCKLIIE